MNQRPRKADFVWTDDEAELLLNVTHEYKVQQLAEGTCWESVRSKYGDILELFRGELPATDEEARELMKDYPHRKDEVTKEILTAKLKAIRNKFRQAVDSGKRSGHGRVVQLYYELCAKIWGGSPATEQISTGVETVDLNASTSVSNDTSTDLEDEGSDKYQTEGSLADNEGQSSNEQPASREAQSANQHPARSEGQSESTADLSASGTGRPRYKRPAIEQYKQQKLKKKIPADSQMIHFAEREIELKEKMMEKLDTMNKDHRETMNLLPTNLKTLSDTMANAFSLLQHSLQMPQPSHFTSHPSHFTSHPSSHDSYDPHYSHSYSQLPSHSHSMMATPSPPGVYLPVPGYMIAQAARNPSVFSQGSQHSDNQASATPTSSCGSSAAPEDYDI